MGIIDLHCDTLPEAFDKNRSLGKRSIEGHLDLPRMRDGGVKLQFFAIFPGTDREVVQPLHRTLQVIEYFRQELTTLSDELVWIRNISDLERCFNSSKLGALLTIEGGEALEGDLHMLNLLFRLGVRGLTLTWNYRNQLADGSDENETGSKLTRFGREVVREMENLGMLIDLSHLSEGCFWDCLSHTTGPVIASHSNCRSLCNHRRNLSDGQIKAIAGRNGVIGVNFVPYFVAEGSAGIKELVDQIDHICRLVGDDFIAFGSDFDGTNRLISGMEDVASYPKIINEMARRGFSETRIEKICSGNVKRVLKLVLR